MKIMILIKNNSNDPYFNLACEEFLMQTAEQDIFMLWQNRPSVILGVSQNAFSEVNIPYANENKITVARRITGGGAVYHDLGNINFSFIVDEDSTDIDFKRFLCPIVDALGSLGVEAEINGRNDIVVNGLKISGNAQCHKYGKILHHGTLLYSTDKEVLTSVLNVDPNKLKSKGVASVRSRVGELKTFIEMPIQELISVLEAAFKTEVRDLTDEQRKRVQALADEKFSTWEFVFGSSKKLEKCVKKRFDGGTVEISFDSEQGIIKDAEIKGDFFSVGDPELLCDSLKNCRLEVSEIEKAISLSECKIYGISPRELAELMMG